MQRPKTPTCNTPALPARAGLRPEILTRSHSLRSLALRLPGWPLTLPLRFPDRRLLAVRFWNGEGVKGSWNTAGSAASEDMPRKPLAQSRELPIILGAVGTIPRRSPVCAGKRRKVQTFLKKPKSLNFWCAEVAPHKTGIWAASKLIFKRSA